MKRETRGQRWKVALLVVCGVALGMFGGMFLGINDDDPMHGEMSIEVERCKAGEEECQQQLLTLSVMLRSLPPEATLADVSERVYLFMSMQAAGLSRLEEIGVDGAKVKATRDAWNDAAVRLLAMAGRDPNSAGVFSMPPGQPGAVFFGPGLLD